jgi:hypothetical protein
MVCEAFLRIEPHFGLRLKIFDVKPRSSDSELSECGGVLLVDCVGISPKRRG